MALISAWAFTPRTLAKAIRAEAITDGPFLDTETVVAGVYILEANDEAAALTIAATNPAIRGAGGVEVRLIHSGGDAR